MGNYTIKKIFFMIIYNININKLGTILFVVDVKIIYRWCKNLIFYLSMMINFHKYLS